MAVRDRRRPLFLERTLYRRSRMIDGARILPIAGFVLILLPILWIDSGRIGVAGQAVYLFVLWIILIAVAFALARLLRPPPAPRVPPAEAPPSFGSGEPS